MCQMTVSFLLSCGSGAQPSKRRSGGGQAPDPDALSEAELWQGIVRALQAARRKLGATLPPCPLR